MQEANPVTFFVNVQHHVHGHLEYRSSLSLSELPFLPI